MSNKMVMILVGMAASLTGFGIGWVYGRKRLCEDFEEVFDSNPEYNDDDFFEDEDDDPDYLGERAVRLEEARKELKAKAAPYVSAEPTLYHKYIIKEDEMNEEETKQPVDELKPVIIDVETYEDEMEQDDWDKAEYTFFAHRTETCPSGILVDEYAGLKVSDPLYDIGSEALDILHAVPEGEEVNVYVRNPILGCDILIKVVWDPLTDEELEAYEDVGDRNEEGGVKG